MRENMRRGLGYPNPYPPVHNRPSQNGRIRQGEYGCQIKAILETYYYILSSKKQNQLQVILQILTIRLVG